MAPELNNDKLIKQIKFYMEDTGKRQYEVAAEIGAPPQTVNRWLNNAAAISNAYYQVLLAKGIVQE